VADGEGRAAMRDALAQAAPPPCPPPAVADAFDPEARRNALRYDPGYRRAWEGAVGALLAGSTGTVISGKTQRVLRQRLCEDPADVVCALAEADGDANVATERLRNEGYRREMSLASELCKVGRLYAVMSEFSLKSVKTLDRAMFTLGTGEEDDDW